MVECRKGDFLHQSQRVRRFGFSKFAMRPANDHGIGHVLLHSEKAVVRFLRLGWPEEGNKGHDQTSLRPIAVSRIAQASSP